MSPAAPRTPRLRLGRRGLKALLAAHIAVSVGLLGDSAGFLAVALRWAGSEDPAFRAIAEDVLGMFALTFGIPLSLLALATGVALSRATRWRIHRHGWVAAKLGLILSVILVGATAMSPLLRTGARPDEAALLLGASWDVLALTAAVGLAVFKPARRRPANG